MRGRIDATPAAVTRWVERFDGRQIEVAVEACTGWLFVCDALAAAGAVAHLVERVETRALRGRKRRAKTIARTRAGCGNCSSRTGRPRHGSRPSISADGARGRGCATR